MRLFAALLLLVLLVACGCSNNPHSFLNGGHALKHITFIYDDLHDLHVDIDHVLLGICDDESTNAQMTCSNRVDLLADTN